MLLLIVRRQHFVGRGNDVDREFGIGSAAVPEDSRPGRAGQFDARRPAADYREFVAPTLLQAPDGPPADVLPGCQESVYGLDADGMFQGAGHAARVGNRADVQREYVERQFRPPRQNDAARFQIDGIDIGLDQPRTAEARQGPQVDEHVLGPIAAGDKGGHGAGIGHEDFPADQGHHQPRHRAHAETAQYCQMTVSAADQHQVFNQRFGCFHGLRRASLVESRDCTSRSLQGQSRRTCHSPSGGVKSAQRIWWGP